LSEEQPAEEKVDAASVDPLEEAAFKFTKLLPYVKKFSATASSQKSLARVLYAMAEFPLGAAEPRFLNENERILFSVLQEIQQHKSVLLQKYVKEALEKEQALKQKGEEQSGREEILA
jgi:hypothetical protein